ncbi:MAG TPA: hypothetical protein DD670_16580, partial [Planctomycetaceae bacterium]|nr:hypothetical protein [Planctomycetaceae bacterium]
SPARPNPVVHWQFDGNVTNSGTGGSTYDGTMVTGSRGSYTYEAGPTGSGLQALRLDNEGDEHFTDGNYVSTPYVMTDEGTISFWCKPNNTSWFNYMSLFDNSGDPSLSDANRANDWEMWIYNNGQARWRVEAGFATADLDDFGGIGEWQHITASWQQYEGVQKASIFLYVNGEFVSGTDDTWVNPGSMFFLGGGHDLNEYAVASFADFRIYDVALTPEQISQLAQLDTAPIPGDATGNNIVDDDDAKRLAANWGATTLAPGLTWWEMGDFNNDNVIDARDAAIMAANWGYGPSEATAVPEPSMWLLLTASLAILLARRQR